MAENRFQWVSAEFNVGQSDGVPGKLTEWNRATVADGKWLNNETVVPLSGRDEYLLGSINELSDDVDTLAINSSIMSADIIHNREMIETKQNLLSAENFKPGLTMYDDPYVGIKIAINTADTDCIQSVMLDNDKLGFALKDTISARNIISPSPFGTVISGFSEVDANAFNAYSVSSNYLNTVNTSGTNAKFDNLSADNLMLVNLIVENLSAYNTSAVKISAVSGIEASTDYGVDSYISGFNTIYADKFSGTSAEINKIVSIGSHNSYESEYIDPGHLIVGQNNKTKDGNSNAIIGANNTTENLITTIVAGGYNTVSGGLYNAVFGNANKVFPGNKFAVAVFGASNEVSGNNYQSIIAGYTNTACNTYQDLITGKINNVHDTEDSIIGGTGVSVSSTRTSIIDGSYNKVSGASNTLIIGNGNTATDEGINDSIIAGSSNSASEIRQSFIIGRENNIDDLQSTVVVGERSSIDNIGYSLVYGEYNKLYDTDCAVLGGLNNNISASHQTVFGGRSLEVTAAKNSFVAGRSNHIRARDGIDASIVVGVGNSFNAASGKYIHSLAVFGDDAYINKSTLDVVFGYNNEVSSTSGSLIGGNSNSATETEQVLLGGTKNIVSGGHDNIVWAQSAHINGCSDSIIGGYKISAVYTHYSNIAGIENSVYDGNASNIIGTGHMLSGVSFSYVCGGRNVIENFSDGVLAGNSLSAYGDFIVGNIYAGYESTISGNDIRYNNINGYKHKIGRNTYYSTIIGDENKVSVLESSLVAGHNINAHGNYVMAFGNGTIASGNDVSVFGKYNTYENSDKLFVIGNGVNDDNRSDAMIVFDNGTLSAKKIVCEDSDFDNKYIEYYIPDSVFTSHSNTIALCYSHNLVNSWEDEETGDIIREEYPDEYYAQVINNDIELWETEVKEVSPWKPEGADERDIRKNYRIDISFDIENTRYEDDYEAHDATVRFYLVDPNYYTGADQERIWHVTIMPGQHYTNFKASTILNGAAVNFVTMLVAMPLIGLEGLDVATPNTDPEYEPQFKVSSIITITDLGKTKKPETSEDESDDNY